MDERIKSWQAEEKELIEGWNFPHLDGRVIEDDPPWSYMDRAQTLMNGADSLLDMDTGGGERLLDMCSSWLPHRGCAPRIVCR